MTIVPYDDACAICGNDQFFYITAHDGSGFGSLVTCGPGGGVVLEVCDKCGNVRISKDDLDYINKCRNGNIGGKRNDD